MELDVRRMMAPETAVAKAREALSGQKCGPDEQSVASLAAALLIREGLVTVARVLSADKEG